MDFFLIKTSMEPDESCYHCSDKHVTRSYLILPQGEHPACYVTFGERHTVDVCRLQPCLLQRLLQDRQNDSTVVPGGVTRQETWWVKNQIVNFTCKIVRLLHITGKVKGTTCLDQGG